MRKKCGEKLINSFLHVPSSSTRRPNNVLYMHVCVYKFLVGVQANIENIFENLSKIAKTFSAKEILKKTSKSICSGVMNHDL